ncbi:MAG: glycoside hydrolase family 88 protein [bacterium]|nr:glycoside hydrolase family 88 protein [bacterium]
MHRYEADRLPPEGAFFYHQGVFLSGMQRVYELCGDERYFRYVKRYVDAVTGPDGEIPGFCHEYRRDEAPFLQRTALTRLDNRQPAILLYQLYEYTGEERYRKAIETVTQSMLYYPVNLAGGYWHMLGQPYQMWLDGAYMAAPLCLLYDQKFGCPVLRERAVNQIFIMNDRMLDPKTGLYFHGWDESKKAPWADPETGLSGQIWGRAVGWYAVAVLQTLELLPSGHPAVGRLKQIGRELLEALANWQDPETGMWFQVLDRPDREDNWVESSCTNLFLCAYAAAIRNGVIDKRYEQVMRKGYQGITDALSWDEEGFPVIDRVCIGTCIDEGTYEHYINRPQTKNDLHGVGAFLLMCAELERYERWAG